MEAKQFPEKWAVRADGKDLTKELSRFNEGDKWALNNKYIKGIRYFLYDGSYLGWDSKLDDGYTEVTLEDLIAHYEPKPKWMPLTRGGYEYKIYEEFDEVLFGRVIDKDGCWNPNRWYTSGRVLVSDVNKNDLIPYNPRISELEEKINSKRSELAELESELKTLKWK